MKNKFYITTPIYYVNDKPHIGHAYTSIVADVLARYHKSIGEEVFFNTGTDEHGAKIAESAKKAGKTPEEFCNNLIPIFQKTWSNLNIKYDYFIRTTNKDHEKFVSDFVTKIKEKGFIYKKKYKGLYCVGDEKFLSKSELVDGKCPFHPNLELVEQEEENWFFKLSEFQKPLLEAIEKGEYQILPETRKNEIVSKIKAGLEDISISRQEVKWGIPVPWDKSQTIYVWFDALLNYLSSLKINKKENLWPANLHLMAKDILWFHAVIWPAMLLAVGEKLPEKIFAHGFFTINGQKMSKTVGNVIDPNEWVNKYGADAVRYYLLTAFPFGEDGDVSEEKLAEKYNSELANELGNLVNRVVTMVERYKIKLTANSQQPTAINSKVSKLIEEFKFDEALRKIWKEVRKLNQAIEENKPWELAKQQTTNNNQLENFLVELAEKLSVVSYQLSVFLPETSEKIQSQLKTLKAEPLFPREK